MEPAFLRPDEVTCFEEHFGQYGLARNEVKSTTEIDCDSHGYGVVEERGQISIVSSDPGAPDLIELIPRFLAWDDADSFLAMINVLDYQVCRVRLLKALREIEKMDSKIAAAMRDALEELPRWAAVRFIIAPATRRRLALLHKDPATHVARLCYTLKAELRLSGKAVSGEGCWTALGDFFVSGKAADFVDPATGGWRSDVNLRAPRLKQVVPVDGVSPNLLDIGSPAVIFERHTAGEFADVIKKLDVVIELAQSAVPAAAQLVRRCVKVIAAVKTNKGAVGSSSHYSLPGQVLLRSSAKATEEMMASALVHEAIHQILYVLESGRRFVDEKSASSRMTAASPWTERQLPIHSYLHACFVWYGLVTFWRRALGSSLLPAGSMEGQFNEALRGFRAGNPADRLLPYRDAICPKAMEAVASLWNEL